MSQPRSPSSMNRRELLRMAAVGTGAAMLPSSLASGRTAPAASSAGGAKRVLRFAHLTDAHVQPENHAEEGLRTCFRHMREHAKPDLIVAGGDQIMDALEAPAERVEIQFDLWNKIAREESAGIAMISVIGNHDVWGWCNRKKSRTTGDEPRYGKGWAIEAFGIPAAYYATVQAGWKIIVLDSTFDDGNEQYAARLDDAQFAWLEAELAKTDPKIPVLVLSHIPIVSFCPLLFLKGEEEVGPYPKPRWNIVRPLLHLDARRIKDLFKRHANVKLAVSGHIHLQDRVDYLGVTYLCNPAICANWWRGPHQEFENAYTIVDLYDDGTFDYEVVKFGWKARS